MAQQKLFVYGTLKQPKIQLAVLGRQTSRQSDILEGYSKGKVVIKGKTYPIAERATSKTITGFVLEVTDEELSLLDDYETTAYKRIKTRLKSGVEAWIYCRP